MRLESITTDMGRLVGGFEVLGPTSFPMILRKNVDDRLRTSGGLSRGDTGEEGVGGWMLISRLFVAGASTVSMIRGSVDFAFRSGVWVRKSAEAYRSRTDMTQ